MLKLSDYLPESYNVKFGTNPYKATLFHNSKTFLIDNFYKKCDIKTLLYMVYATFFMRECLQDVCKADKKALFKIRSLGFKTDKLFFQSIISVLSDQNPARKQMLKEMINRPFKNYATD